MKRVCMALRFMAKALLGSAIILCALARPAEAQFTWKTGFQYPGGNGLNDLAYVLTVFDDGSGPALYAGGAFVTAGDVLSSHIAKWAP